MQTHLRSLAGHSVTLALFVAFASVVALVVAILYLTGSFALFNDGAAGQIIWGILNATFITYVFWRIIRTPKAKPPK